MAKHVRKVNKSYKEKGKQKLTTVAIDRIGYTLHTAEQLPKLYRVCVRTCHSLLVAFIGASFF